MHNMDEILEAVQEFNQEIFEAHQVDAPLSLKTDGFTHAIMFFGHCLWSSEIDDRYFDENTNDYEPLLPYLKKEFNNYADRLQALKFLV